MNEGSGTLISDYGTGRHDGTLAGATIPIWVSGKISNGLSFDGSSSFVNPALSVNGFSAISLQCWFKTSVSQSNKYAVSFPDGGSNNGFDFYFNGSNSMGSICKTTAGTLDSPFGTVVYADGNWHMVSITYDGVKHRGYFDGSLKFEFAATGTIFARVNSLYIGKGFSGGGNFNGVIDEVRVWNRAISLVEHQAFYNI